MLCLGRKNGIQANNPSMDLARIPTTSIRAVVSGRISFLRLCVDHAPWQALHPRVFEWQKLNSMDYKGEKEHWSWGRGGKYDQNAVQNRAGPWLSPQWMLLQRLPMLGCLPPPVISIPRAPWSQTSIVPVLAYTSIETPINNNNNNI